MTYSEKLKDPRWQKRRLELLNAAGWKCGACGATNKVLHVHHGCYFRGFQPWEYAADLMHVLCDDCHKATQATMEDAHAYLAQIHPRDLEPVAGLILMLSMMGCPGSRTKDLAPLARQLSLLGSLAASVRIFPKSAFDVQWLREMADIMDDESKAMLEVVP